MLDIKEPTTIELNINTDGLPLFNASKYEFWPILVNIHNIRSRPFVIGIFYGEGKPSSAKEFLAPFVDELCLLVKNETIINTHKIDIAIRCFFADAPCRAFIKGTVSFNSYDGCLICSKDGVMIDRRMAFPHYEGPLRTDAAFRNKEDPDHHKRTSKLEDLPIDMITQILIGDEPS